MKRHILILISLLLATLVLLPAPAAAQTAGAKCRVTPYRDPAVRALPAHKAAGGIIIVERDSLTRAVQPFAGTGENLLAYADAVSSYAKALDSDVRVYCMPIPLSSEFYLPDTAAVWSKSQAAAINRIYDRLAPGVTPVNAYNALAAHSAEPIYNRTDHHWAPLGAYYAAEAFARAADVPFLPLTAYERHEVPGYVGTMYKFSKDTAVRNAPEVFEYFTPLDTAYVTTTVTYTLDKARRRVIAASEPKVVPFFHKFRSAGGAYLTFMGGDSNQTSVRTSTPGSRRVLILKDSYGNALPPFLFGSFEEVHVVDCRYFRGNIVSFVRRHGITDVVFVNNLGHVATPATTRKYLEYLTQE